MALVKFGAGIVQMSGSIGGTTFARNRFGNYSRAKTKPVNPQTSAQVLVRATLATLTTRWSETLTAAQRTAWNLYGASLAMLNKLGETVYLTGFNHYIRSNSMLLRAGFTIVDAGPTDFELPSQDGTFAITASAATQVISAVYDDTQPWCDLDEAYMHLFVGRPQNPQRNFFNGPWTIAAAIEGDSASPPTSPEAIASPVVFVEGQRIWVYARIQLPDGRLSQPFRADTFCAA